MKYFFIVALLLTLGGCAGIPQPGTVYSSDINNPNSPAVVVDRSGALYATTQERAEAEQAQVAEMAARPQPPQPGFWCNGRLDEWARQNCPQFQQQAGAATVTAAPQLDQFPVAPQPNTQTFSEGLRPAPNNLYREAYANQYSDHSLIALFEVRDTVQKRSGAAIRAEIYNLYLNGVGGDQSLYTPNNPRAIADATDNTAREILTEIQTAERNGNNRTDVLAILKRGNLLNGSQLIMVNNFVAAKCLPTNNINSFGEVIWQCQRQFRVR